MVEIVWEGGAGHRSQGNNIGMGKILKTWMRRQWRAGIGDMVRKVIGRSGPMSRAGRDLCRKAMVLELRVGNCERRTTTNGGH